MWACIVVVAAKQRLHSRMSLKGTTSISTGGAQHLMLETGQLSIEKRAARGVFAIALA